MTAEIAQTRSWFYEEKRAGNVAGNVCARYPGTVK